MPPVASTGELKHTNCAFSAASSASSATVNAAAASSSNPYADTFDLLESNRVSGSRTCSRGRCALRFGDVSAGPPASEESDTSFDTTVAGGSMLRADSNAARARVRRSSNACARDGSTGSCTGGDGCFGGWPVGGEVVVALTGAAAPITTAAWMGMLALIALPTIIMLSGVAEDVTALDCDWMLSNGRNNCDGGAMLYTWIGDVAAPSAGRDGEYDGEPPRLRSDALLARDMERPAPGELLREVAVSAPPPPTRCAGSAL